MPTLFTDETREYFFIVPDDVELLPGDVPVYKLPTETETLVHPDAILPYMVSYEDAHEFLSQTLRIDFEDILDSVTSSFKNLWQRFQTYKSPYSTPRQDQALESDAKQFWRNLGKMVDGVFSDLLAEVHQSPDVTEQDAAQAIIDDVLVASLLKNSMQTHPDVMYWLVMAHRGQQLRIIPLDKPRLLGGRKYSNDIVLLGTEINRVHFSIEWTDQGHCLICHSSTGIQVNEALLGESEAYFLRSGDIIKIADHYLRFEYIQHA